LTFTLLLLLLLSRCFSCCDAFLFLKNFMLEK
jgi:hypothetical protein